MRFVKTDGFQTYSILNAYLKKNSLNLDLPKMLNGNFLHSFSPTTE